MPLLEQSVSPIAPEDRRDLPVSNLLLWFAALGGPIAWAAHLMIVYPLVEVACRFGTRGVLFGASAALGLIAALSGAVGLMYLRRIRAYDGATVPRRVRFMARGGLLGAVLFLILIAAGTLPILFDDPCQLPGRREPSVLPML